MGLFFWVKITVSAIYSCMILLKRGEQARIPVTVTEMSGGGYDFYRFVFTHLTTKKIYTIILHIEGDTPERIDYFPLDVDALLDESDDGFFDYEIYTNGVSEEDPELPGELVEIGKMKLEGERTMPVKYNGTRKEYKTYGK